MLKKNWLLLIVVLFSINLVLGLGYDWDGFGNDLKISQSQLGKSNINFSVTTDTVSFGQDQYTHPTQPLVSQLSGTENYLILQDGNYIKIYDDNLDLVTELFLTEQAIGQLSTVDWNDDGKDEIAGYFRSNSTLIYFKVYSLNITTLVFNNIYSLGMVSPSVNGVTGLKCDNDECYGVLYETNTTGYLWYHQLFNSSGVTNYLLYPLRLNNSYYPREPPAKVDYDGNGEDDFLIFSRDNVVVYDEDGNIIQDYNITADNVAGAKFIDSDSSPYYKLAILYDSSNFARCNSHHSCSRLRITNILDESVIFEGNVQESLSSSDNARSQGIAIGDWDDDGYDEIFAVGSRISLNYQSQLKVYDYDGTILDSATFGSIGRTYPSSQITLGDFDEDNNLDVVIYNSSLNIYSLADNGFIYDHALGFTGNGSCIPADLTFDGRIDLICSDTSNTRLFYESTTNNNSRLVSINYNPSTSINTGQTVTATINATDDEGDTIYYSYRCDDDESFSESTNNQASCSYNTTGTYNFATRVRDLYHSSYDSYVQVITVTSVSGVTQAEGGLAIPTKLVDPENTEQGLLPEIYYGSLGFMSNVLQPMIVLVFVIFFALIMITIGVIIKKIGEKVGSL